MADEVRRLIDRYEANIRLYRQHARRADGITKQTFEAHAEWEYRIVADLYRIATS